MQKEKENKKEGKLNFNFFEYEKDRYFSHIYNLGCAAALLVLGFKLGVDKKYEERCNQKSFAFKSDVNMDKVVTDYFSNKLLINAQDMSICIQMLINGIESKPKK